MILVDTSSWIHLLRDDGDPVVRARVEAALRSGEACWCPIVQLELWNGARGSREKRALEDFRRVLPTLAIDDSVWRDAYEIARRARRSGITIPSTDIVIAACARRHGALMESADSDFQLLRSVVG
ncbi:MAG: PIN domain nuclease [Acidobacteria bacterium]|nr:PIN domain nuclease [Acidobacteriota bacterium]MXZ73331.1 PIN domain nuclease [Acidobacteriota bacterium]MYD72606.1 PIN domain nuclease [Acidobacteriota bacterium]MYJ05262.1 PIN domain nuclease [Acidobacteriota bacterium]